MNWDFLLFLFVSFRFTKPPAYVFGFTLNTQNRHLGAWDIPKPLKLIFFFFLTVMVFWLFSIFHFPFSLLKKLGSHMFCTWLK
jgi:hypothetical protein